MHEPRSLCLGVQTWMDPLAICVDAGCPPAMVPPRSSLQYQHGDVRTHGRIMCRPGEFNFLSSTLATLGVSSESSRPVTLTSRRE